MKKILNVLLLLSPLVTAGQSPADLRARLPRVEGWTLSDKIEVFNPENLFDRINGAAPLYIENNFREMTSMEYTRGETYITIQVYRHATPEDAFGMYAAERSTGLAAFPVGGEAQGDEESLSFFVACLYVKMWSNGTGTAGEVIREIATAFARETDPRAGYPAILRLFPSRGKEPYSECYTTSNYLGHEFLKGVYSARYRQEDLPYQLFVVATGSNEEARAVLEKYFTFTKQPLSFDEGELLVKDRYNGDLPLLWQGVYITGIFPENESLPANARDILKNLSGKLLSQPSR
ncbi:MAG: hypothetical protein LBF09_02770 [Odoribacteraceae bacterium]|jgi:hypothetical protein|nr:hypothetical protein [Odoribacteraceae bacterium]